MGLGPVLDAASAVHHTATTGGSWDGPGAVSAMPNSKAVLTYCHAWHAADAGDEKSGYKFPHHRTQGGPAVVAACSAALGRLDQADIPEADKAGVRSHVQAHLNDARKGEDSEDIAPRPSFAARNYATGRDPAAPFYSIKAKAAPDTDELWIYDEVGFSNFFTGEGLTASSFAKDLRALKSRNLVVRINSPGGDVFDGLAIRNLLAEHPATVTVKIDALAASIASVIAQAADKIVIDPYGRMMIHDASGFAIGNSADMLEMAAILDGISDDIARVYADRAGGEPADWRKIMRDEHWYTAAEAVKAGLADEMGAPRNTGKGDGEDEDLPDCPDCKGTGFLKGKPCPKCEGTGKMPAPDGEGSDDADEAQDAGKRKKKSTSMPPAKAPAQARALALAASWCGRLFPDHEHDFLDALGTIEALPLETPLPAPAVEGRAGAAPDTPREAAPEPFTWDPAELTGAVRHAIQPPAIDLSDWRSWFANMPDAPAPTPQPVDLGPLPPRPVEPEPVRNELAELLGAALDLAHTRAHEPAPAGPVDLGPPPARPVEPEPVRNELVDLLDAALDLAHTRAHEPAPATQNLPVDLGPPPERPVDPPPSIPRNPLAELIAGATRNVINDQPEPDPPSPPVAGPDPLPSVRLDVADVRRALREARF